MFPGRRGAGHIFHTQVRLSGQVPQVCLLFGPSAAGGAYIPAFCDVVIMRDGNASMYLGSPRMAEMVIGEKVTPRGDGRCADAHLGLRLRPLPERIRRGRDRSRRAATSRTCPPIGERSPPAAPPADPAESPAVSEIVPANEKDPFDVKRPDRRGCRRRLIPRGARALGQGGRRRLRAARRPGDRDRGEPAEGEGRRAVRRLRRQGGALHHDLQRLQRPAALPGRRARLHDRQGRRARRGSSGTGRR